MVIGAVTLLHENRHSGESRGDGMLKELGGSPALYPRQQIDLRALRQFRLPAVAVDAAVDRDGDAARDVRGHAGVGFFELAEQFADGPRLD